MCVDDDRLQKSHSLIFCSSFGIKHASGCCPGNQFSHHLHVSEQQRAGNKIGIIGVERDLRLSLALSVCRESFGNIEETVYLSFLQCDASICYIAVMVNYFCLSE